MYQFWFFDFFMIFRNLVPNANIVEYLCKTFIIASTRYTSSRYKSIQSVRHYNVFDNSVKIDHELSTKIGYIITNVRQFLHSDEYR